MSSHRERIAKALRGEATDRVPRGEFFIADEFVRAFLNLPETTAPLEFERYRSVVEELDLDVASVALSWGWGSVRQPDEDHALECLMHWRTESKRFVFALIDGPFSTAVQTSGFEALMRYVHSIPHLAFDLFGQAADQVRMIAQAARDAGADGIVLGEDVAYHRSTFFSPTQLSACYFPALSQTVRDIHGLGLVVFFHSEGNLSAVLDDIAASGVDGLQGLESESGMSVQGVRERLGTSLALWGNLSYEFLSAVRSEQEIQETVRAITSPSFLSPSGERDGEMTHKLILGSCGGLVAGLKLETVRRLYQAIG